MNAIKTAIIGLLLPCILLSGCMVPAGGDYASSNKSVRHASEASQLQPIKPAISAEDTKAPQDMDLTDPSRLYVKVGSICLQVPLMENAKRQIHDLLRKDGGYVEVLQTNYMAIRVPSDKFQILLNSLKQVGDIIDQDIRIVDVTDSFHDLDAELKNLIATRDRFKVLLEKAQTIKDALAIENELNRIQTRIDQITARKAEMQKKIAYAKLTIRLLETTSGAENDRFRPTWWLSQIGLNNLFAQ